MTTDERWLEIIEETISRYEDITGALVAASYVTASMTLLKHIGATGSCDKCSFCDESGYDSDDMPLCNHCVICGLLAFLPVRNGGDGFPCLGVANQRGGSIIGEMLDVRARIEDSFSRSCIQEYLSRFGEYVDIITFNLKDAIIILRHLARLVGEGRDASMAMNAVEWWAVHGETSEAGE